MSRPSDRGDAEPFAHSQRDDQAKIYGRVIGIDLGTTYSSVGVIHNGKVEILANNRGFSITPSYIVFDDEECLVGDAAKDLSGRNSTRTLFNIKRLIGRKFNDKDVQDDIKNFPFKIVEKDDKPLVEVNINQTPKILSAEEDSAMIIRNLKDVAEGYLGESVTHAVVTVPACFNNAQRQATKDAGTIAGLHIPRVINEPTAAGIAYGLDMKNKSRNVIVYNLGGGTFVEDGIFEVITTAGDMHLGGEDFNYRVMDYFVQQYNKSHVDVTKDLKAVHKLKREVERAKRILSSQMSTQIEIEAFYNGEDFSATLARAKFEELNMDLFKKTLKYVEQVLKDARMPKSEVDDIVLVGGSTRIPMVRSFLETFFHGKTASKGINPDEAIAFGAAIQAGILSSAKGADNLVVMDINSLTLRIETPSGVMGTLIPRNTVIPTRKSQIFSPATDKRSSILVQFYEGEKHITKENNLLGMVELTSSPPAPRGVPQIEVSFELDDDGILKVSASDQSTGEAGSIIITDSKGCLTQEEINRMVAEAEQFAEEDRAIKLKLEACNGLENYVYMLKGQFEDEYSLRGQINTDDKQTILGAVKEVIDWLDANRLTATANDFNEQKQQLSNIAYPITSKLYGSAPASSAGDDNDDYGQDEL